jgi:DNA-binding MarR family transcriptional regulator
MKPGSIYEGAARPDEGFPSAPAPLASAAASLDRIIHERSRLAMLAHLAVRGEASFQQLRQFFNLSDGNLSSHLRVLEEAGLVRVHKGFRGRRPLTLVEMTPLGKREFGSYLDQLESVIRSARSGLGG